MNLFMICYMNHNILIESKITSDNTLIGFHSIVPYVKVKILVIVSNT